MYPGLLSRSGSDGPCVQSSAASAAAAPAAGTGRLWAGAGAGVSALARTTGEGGESGVIGRGRVVQAESVTDRLN